MRRQWVYPRYRAGQSLLPKGSTGVEGPLYRAGPGREGPGSASASGAADCLPASEHRSPSAGGQQNVRAAASPDQPPHRRLRTTPEACQSSSSVGVATLRPRPHRPRRDFPVCRRAHVLSILPREATTSPARYERVSAMGPERMIRRVVSRSAILVSRTRHLAHPRGMPPIHRG